MLSFCCPRSILRTRLFGGLGRRVGALRVVRAFRGFLSLFRIPGGYRTVLLVFLNHLDGLLTKLAQAFGCLVTELGQTLGLLIGVLGQALGRLVAQRSPAAGTANPRWWR